MITPWGIYMKPSRTGGLYVWPPIVSAEPMTSNRGRARAAPIPCRQVRRSNTALLIIGCPLFRDATMREWVTGHDRSDERLHAVSIRGNVPHQTINHDFIIAFQPSAQGISQNSLHEVARKIIGAFGDDGF